MSFIHSPKFLRTVLLVDATTCVATGLLMALGADLVTGLTAIPASLLRYMPSPASRFSWGLH